MSPPTTGTKFKRGTRFHASIVFDEDEWASVFPYTSLKAEARQEGAFYPLDVTVDEVNRIIDVSADTSKWCIGYAEFDVKIVTPNGTFLVPPTKNIGFRIVEGVTR